MSGWRALGWSLLRTHSRIDRLTRAIAIPNPAAGADWSVRVPGGCAWRLLSLNSLLTASATVATRNPNLRFDSSEGTFMNMSAPTGTGAGLILNYAFTLKATPNGVPVTRDTISSPLPDLWLVQGTNIRVQTLNLQAGDQWTNIVLYIDELIALEDDWRDAAGEDAARHGEQATVTISVLGS